MKQRAGFVLLEDVVDERKDRRPDIGNRERDRRYKDRNSSERSRRDKASSSRPDKRGESHSHDEAQGNKVEDKRVTALRSSHGRNSPSDRSDNDSSSKSQKRNSASRGEISSLFYLDQCPQLLERDSLALA